ncbi:hypothetical protein LEP1GSC202_1010 [Leptospira yanagawae serovar Saopaulo str. Sao Paulo = ATCC 700523]|uniref:Uncharacterized protein n=1 Tax=Leptospira yanagawae serovar Saopaulo str. Sao Paulo = ATCC 700523 TaxID=1249483 RepID=A0A5E8HBI8_9LEPT|nr:hypothetical protein LEP1GSC202_1010 [Leptospira yanagawae serovar Saopaulo str. Sao Paulo = ATCC 700523]
MVLRETRERINRLFLHTEVENFIKEGKIPYERRIGRR